MFSENKEDKQLAEQTEEQKYRNAKAQISRIQQKLGKNDSLTVCFELDDDETQDFKLDELPNSVSILREVSPDARTIKAVVKVNEQKRAVYGISVEPEQAETKSNSFLDEAVNETIKPVLALFAETTKLNNQILQSSVTNQIEILKRDQAAMIKNASEHQEKLHALEIEKLKFQYESEKKSKDKTLNTIVGLVKGASNFVTENPAKVADMIDIFKAAFAKRVN